MRISDRNKRIAMGILFVLMTALLDVWMFNQNYVCFGGRSGGHCYGKNLLTISIFILIYNGLTLYVARTFFLEAFRGRGGKKGDRN